ncbi:hypothetical protein ACA910_010501 [Epithemia clementina (nom. ined.)]
MSSELRLRHLDDHYHHNHSATTVSDVESGVAIHERKEHSYHGVFHRLRLRMVRFLFYFHTMPPRQKIVVTLCLCLLVGTVLVYFVKTQEGDISSLKSKIVTRLQNLTSRTKTTLNDEAAVVLRDVKVSVVIMNHNRPRMLKESTLITTLANHENIGEILLCHSNPLTMFEHSNPKVRNLNAILANREYGLSLRFRLAAKHAKYPWTIQVDDDQEMSSEAITRLLAEFATDTRRIVGRYGRSYNLFWNRQRHGYNTRNIIGPAEVVLTKFMVMETRLCHYFVKYQSLIDASFLSESHPLWNGEDIFMSLVANHVYGVPLQGPYRNYALTLPVWEASDALKDDDTGQHDVSGNMDRHRLWNVGWSAYWQAYRKAQLHTAYRGKLWSMAKDKLSELPIPHLSDDTSILNNYDQEQIEALANLAEAKRKA